MESSAPVPSHDEASTLKPYIFVSYSHQDQAEVKDDLEQLRRLGFRIWRDDRILVGRAWRESIEQHITNCTLFMLFVSGNALKSDHVLAELDVAKIVKKTKNTTLLSVFLADDISDTNFDYAFLRRHQGIDKFKYKSSLMEYYFDLVKKIEEIAPATREDSLERDSTILGLGYLPTFRDVLRDHRSLTQKEQEERRGRVVLKMRNETDAISAYRISNVFQLTSETTRAMQHLGALKVLKSDRERPTNLLSLPLHIDEAYISPLRLIVGLITRLDQNWPPLVASYSKLVKRDQTNHLEDLHYYIEFCWLAWGPSVLTTSLLCEDRDFMVAQAAFGDEANSLPLIMRRAMWQTIEAKLGKRDSGWPVSLDNILVVRPGIDDFFLAVRDYPLFAEVFSDASQVALYLPYRDQPYADGEVTSLVDKREAYYSTAYVWLMLEQVRRDELMSSRARSGPMEPGRVIPFFEHANLAKSKGLDFLQRCLARKAIHHVLDCEADPAYREAGFYRFATALFPEEMVRLIGEEIAKLPDKDRKILTDRLYVSRDRADWCTPIEVVKFADAVEKVIESSCQSLIDEVSA